MTRLGLVLLLALSLWPSSAAAGTGVHGPGAPDREAAEMHADHADYESHAFRSSAGIAGICGLEAHGFGPRSTHRSGTGGSPLRLLSGSELMLGWVRLRIGPGAQDTDDVPTPLCEHLPYDCTAPPSSR